MEVIIVKKAGCILLNNDKTKVALVYREKRNDYSFPKGHVEGNEKLWECAIRETEEETGRECILFSKRLHTKMKYFTSTEGNVTVYMFYAFDNGETIKDINPLDKECLIWVKLEDVVDILTYDNLKEFWSKALLKINNIRRNLWIKEI